MKWRKDDIAKLPPEYQKQIRDQLAVCAPNMEPDTGNAAKNPNAVKSLDEKVRIHIHSIRKRLADSDGICGKYVIDGLVLSGLLPDDSPQWVEAVTFSQEQGEPERTIITLL